MPERSWRVPAIASPAGRKQCRDGALLSGADLDHQMPAGREQTRRIRGDRAVGRKSVRAAIERVARIVLAHLWRERRDVGARHIGRIGDDEIEWSVERAAVVGREKRRAVAKAKLLCVRRARPRAHPSSMSVPMPLRVRQFGQQRQQDRARTGAEIGDAQRSRARAVAIEQRERQFDDGFGFGPRHQHGRRDDQRQAPEFLLADNARDGLAREAARGELLDLGTRVRSEICCVAATANPA